ncbi:MAG: hypothetical protein JSS77_15930 [Acidobacteria bacterium]|nr:hypothetical protein [Acidobacteriota bacterium]
MRQSIRDNLLRQEVVTLEGQRPMSDCPFNPVYIPAWQNVITCPICGHETVAGLKHMDDSLPLVQEYFRHIRARPASPETITLFYLKLLRHWLDVRSRYEVAIAFNKTSIKMPKVPA